MQLIALSNIVILFTVVLLILVVAFKIFFKKERPSNFYTPFDYITGQTDQEFHEEQEEWETEEDEETGEGNER
ncbi:hypothetical protein N781_14425 [Pontibacillus halophilus JSM 076056 = DSM 19796]|uniref:DUF3951 domain-containing protein n=1 Tax=Pontibacillus halophilus JSM 076056 = DSM 19796 TaxID=1385510 RepID=A0A0A5GKQ8_9BACI|nr:DUF3951 domain-containing protein [Pontibacillus halophilus]KGX92534.1 hypothetical protein N781_14425 [Pontibacillus halophilus JSM 076056 = DSM 19796]